MKKFIGLLSKISIFIIVSSLYFFFAKKLVNMVTTTIQSSNIIEIICVLVYICIVGPIILVIIKKLC